MGCFKPPTAKPKPQPVVVNSSKKNDIRVLTVEVNGDGKYTDCNQLWTGIVTNLGTEIENYFGTWKVRLYRLLLQRNNDKQHSRYHTTSIAVSCCCMRCKIYMLLLCVLSLLIMSIAALVLLGTTDNDALDRIKITRFIVAVTSLLGTITAVLTGEKTLYLTRSTI